MKRDIAWTHQPLELLQPSSVQIRCIIYKINNYNMIMEMFYFLVKKQIVKLTFGNNLRFSNQKSFKIPKGSFG